MSVDPVVARAAIELRIGPSLEGRLAAIAGEHPLVIDYFASPMHGVMIGDLTATFDKPPPEPCFVELASVGGVTVLAQRRLLDLLEGARLVEAGPPWDRHIILALARPEAWIDFLERHGRRAARSA